ncbi:MAG: hypothetical protein ACI8SI_000317, partial [Congregibacter sp.]
RQAVSRGLLRTWTKELTPKMTGDHSKVPRGELRLSD